MFVKGEIKEEIKKLSDLMWEALTEKRYEKEDPNPRPDRWDKETALRMDRRFMTQ
jgi:hypothetical protein